MTDRDVVERVGRLLRRTVVPLRARAAHHKQPFAVTIKGTDAARLMAPIASEMGARRRSQIASALDGWGDDRQRWSYSDAGCAADDCTARASSRGLCDRHYNLWYKATTRGRSTAIVPHPMSPADVIRVRSPWVCDETCAIPWLAGLLEGE